MARYLATIDADASLSVNNACDEGAGHEAYTWIKEVAGAMAIRETDQRGGWPSILSPAFNFSKDLLLDPAADRRVLGITETLSRYQEGWREFRGIACVLLLRDVLRLNLKLTTLDPMAHTGTQMGNDYRRILRSCLRSTPGFNDGFLRCLSIISTEGASDTLCILSPYSLFFPAASPLRNCRSIFWYNNEAHRWGDPTEFLSADKENALKPEIIELKRQIRGIVYRWLERVLPTNNGSMVWDSRRLFEERAPQLTTELRRWKKEIGDSNAYDTSISIDVLSDRVTEAANIQPLLDQAVRLGAAPAVDRTTVLNSFVCQLPQHNGRRLLSKALLKDKSRRICGLTYGSDALASSLSNLDDMLGESFVLKQGETNYYINEPFLNVDKLFLDRLHMVGENVTAPNFFTLLPSGLPKGGEEYYLLPLNLEALKHVDIEGMRNTNPKVRRDILSIRSNGSERVVTLKFGGEEFTKTYPIGEVERTRNLDLRLFPDFWRTPALGEPAREYFLRIRQLPGWELRVGLLLKGDRSQIVEANLHGDHNQVLEPKSLDSNIGDDPNQVPEANPSKDKIDEEPNFHAILKPLCEPELKISPTKQAKFYQFVTRQEPVGFYFLNRGVLLFSLSTIREQLGFLPAAVGVDFGTTNTCVAFRPKDQKVQAVQFALQTTALHVTPSYRGSIANPAMEITEGGAAMLDFPFYNTRQGGLSETAYFPSLFVAGSRKAGTAINFRLGYGRFLPAVSILEEGASVSSLLQGYPQLTTPKSAGEGKTVEEGDHRPFILYDEIKWRNKQFRSAFLLDLSKTIQLYALRNGFTVESVKLSFPRAFTPDMLREFSAESVAAFRAHFGIASIANDSNHFVSESDAVSRYFHDPAQRPDSDYMVIDVGGGTTDFLAILHHDKATLQASYKMAASFVNDYFASSSALREALFQAIQKVVPLTTLRTITRDWFDLTLKSLAETRKSISDTDTAPEQFESYVHQVFFRLLSFIDDTNIHQIFANLMEADGKSEQTRKAIAGFFQTLVLIYGGIMHSAGLLLKTQGMFTGNLRIKFIGNGSKFFQLLRSVTRSPDALDKCFITILASAWGHKPAHCPEIEFTPDGKTYIAKGLVVEMQNALPPAEQGWVADGFDYLCGKEPARPSVASEAAELRNFIETLMRCLKDGQVQNIAGGRETVVPFSPDMAAELNKLIDKLLGVGFPEAENLERKRCSAAYLRYVEEEGQALPGATDHLREARAREPLFIIHLKTLLHAIRKEYAEPLVNTPSVNP